MPVKSKVKVRLAELNIKQKDLAERFQVNKQTVNGWVTGRVAPTLETTLRLAIELDCKVEDLYEFIEDDGNGSNKI